jgi:hypothetical protein
MEIIPARSGACTAIIAGIALHSRYDPLREAERFVQTSLQGEIPSAIVLLGAGLGYLVDSLRRRFPSARLLALYYDARIHEKSLNRAELAWHPGMPEDPEAWLRRMLCELDLEGLRVLEWPPSSRIFPDLARRARRAVEQVARELRGSMVTTQAAGRRWMRNSLLNFLNTRSLIRPAGRAGGRPVLLAASGPSLQESACWIRRCRDRLRLWALPSAALFLREEGLPPDLVVLTDPGFYALYHLHPLAGRPLRLAMPLSAAAGCWRLSAEVLWFSQGNFFEEALLDQAGLKAPAVPPHGTVAASALELALLLSNGPVILAGLDLCLYDIRSHVRPNTFERFLEPAAGRLSPMHDLLFRQAADRAPHRRTVDGARIRSGLPLETYAGWFAALPHRDRVYRLHPSPVALPAMREIAGPDLPPLIEAAADPDGRGEAAGWAPLAGFPGRAERSGMARGLLADWAQRIRRSLHRLNRERRLGPLIEDPFLLDFAYYFDAGSLTEIKRTARLQGEPAAVPPAARLLEAAASFVGDLIEELGGEWRKT